MDPEVESHTPRIQDTVITSWVTAAYLPHELDSKWAADNLQKHRTCEAALPLESNGMPGFLLRSFRRAKITQMT